MSGQDWMWCYENPREAASEIDRLRIALIKCRMTQGGRFGMPWEEVEREINTALGYKLPSARESSDSASKGQK